MLLPQLSDHNKTQNLNFCFKVGVVLELKISVISKAFDLRMLYAFKEKVFKVVKEITYFLFQKSDFIIFSIQPETKLGI
jgi:hypothetical protein